MRRILAVVLTVVLGAVGTLGPLRAADDPINTPSLPREAYFAILDQCATAWDPADRNIYTADGASLNDVDRATRTMFVNVWQLDAWQRWRWEADCLGTARSAQLGTPGSVRTTDDAITAQIPPPRDYSAILDQCATAWDPLDRNIYATDGLSLNDVDRAVRTAFVTVWQVDAWQRWRWEADCLRVALPGGTAASATVRVTDNPISAQNLPPQVYSAILDQCTPVWNPADRNIYATGGLSLNDVDRAVRTAFVTVWQVDAWQRWRWEADCLRAAPPGRVATLDTVRVTDDPINAPSLLPQDYSATLDYCAPRWDPLDRNIYATDGSSLNDVNRATRTTFVTVWQVDAWQRWRWEADCLRAARSERIGTPGSVRTTEVDLTTLSLPPEVYSALLDQCAPAWDPMDRNIYTTDGTSLNGEDRVARTAFVSLWQLDAWQRWRWESDCLRVAFTPADESPAGVVGSTAGSVGSPPAAVGSSDSPVESPPGAVGPRSPQAPAQDPTTHPVYRLVVQTAVARGADDALARDIAIQVVSEERFEDFLNGTHEGVLYGRHECTVRNAACPLAPEATHIDSELSSGPPGTAHQHGGPSAPSGGVVAQSTSYPSATRLLRQLEDVGAHSSGGRCDENGWCQATHIIGFDRRSGSWYLCYVFDYSNPSAHLVPQNGGDHTAYTDPNQVCRRF